VFLNLRITYKNDTTLDIKAEWDDFIAFEDEFDLPFTVVIDPKKSRLKHSTPAGTLVGLVKRAQSEIQTFALKGPEDLAAAQAFIAEHGGN
jgi:hypothetical protein